MVDAVVKPPILINLASRRYGFNLEARRRVQEIETVRLVDHTNYMELLEFYLHHKHLRRGVRYAGTVRQ
jgi:hypothetical protein